MAGVKKPLWILAVAFSAALLASCASSSEAPVGIYGNPPTLEAYFDNLGELKPFVELISGAQPSKGEYQAVVDRYRESGLEGLGDDDRRVLLAVSQMAFLSHQRTLRYSLVAHEAGPSEGRAVRGRCGSRGSVRDVEWTASHRREAGGG